MRIAVMGTGGVGGYFGGMLAKAGHDVNFIARGQHLTRACKRPPIASARSSLWPLAAPEAWR